MIEIIENLIKEAKKPNVKQANICIALNQVNLFEQYKNEINKLSKDNNCNIALICSSTMAPKILVTYLGN